MTLQVYLVHRKGDSVIELMKKTVMAGIGLALKTRDEVEDFVKDLVKRGSMSEKEGKKFLDELLSRYDEAKLKLEERVEKIVKDFLKKADVVTGDELKALKKEIRELKKAISTGTDKNS
jgi:polyhydroxyalkanoate synthesis regulator phasin